MPNVFTPNFDGKNDRFKPRKVGEILNYTIEIYNRWGTMVYKSGDLEEGWDGSFMNISNDCPDGVYFFLASYMAHIYPQPDRLSTLSGTVTLLR
jgi:gliding motility-associated-like protein